MDLRTPIGWFFLLLSVLLLGTAAFAPGDGAAVNGICGASMAIFGAVMLWLSKRRA